MPRKQNGFGNIKSFATKAVKPTNDKFDKGLAPKAAGVYPSNRRYGTSVQRTVIERYDAESDWIRWRKGFEYYCKAAYESLIQYDPLTQSYKPAFLRTQLYPGTPFELDVEFYGWRFSTRDSDSANHYVMKRTAKLYDGSQPELFFVTNVLFDEPLAKENNEIWVQGTRGKDFEILGRSIGDRLTDGKTEATLTYLLNEFKQPAIYTGKTIPDKKTEITVLTRTDDIMNTDFMAENNNDIRAFIGEIGMLPKGYRTKTKGDVNSIAFTDAPYFFNVTIEDTIEQNTVQKADDFVIFDNRETSLPASLYDLTELEPIFVSNRFEGYIKGSYEFQKSDYQRFFGNEYLTAELVEQQVTDIAYPTLPFLIKDVRYKNAKYNVEFTAEPLLSTLDMYSVPSGNSPGYLVFADYSFTQTMLDTIDGKYAHPLNGPYDSVFDQIAADNEFSKLVWYKKVNNIEPYKGYINDEGTISQVFNDPNKPLYLADIYSCSCPSYSQAQLRMPQSTQGPEERKVNRQRNYPLPTVMSKKDYESIGTDSAAGVMQTWQNDRAAASYKLCKHTVASMFDEHLKLQEPNTYQTIDAREEFGAKLAADIKEVPLEFYESYARGGINTLEIIFALAQGLNYDDVEIADLVLNAKF